MNKIKKVDLKEYKYAVCVDTETIGTLTSPETVLPFDVSLKIIDLEENCKVVFKKCYLIRKFFNNQFVMNTSFSASKYPMYKKRLEEDKTNYKLVSVKELSKAIDKILKKYNVSLFVAHNGNFDLTALERLFNNFECGNPFKKCDLLDTMEISRNITSSKEYYNFCKSNRKIKNNDNSSKFVTNGNRPRLTAESIYCYLVDNVYYSEEHTGLQDIDIEIYILKYSLEHLGNTFVTLNTESNKMWKEYSSID